MNPRSHMLLRGAAVTAAVAMVSVSALPAVAAEGDVQVVNTETVQVYTDATGAVESQRIYEQLAFTGSGAVELRNPVEESGLRNLEGFSGFEVENGEQVAELEVDGKEHLRTVSEYTGSLPLDVEVEYYLDGERVEPGDVVGEGGELEVKYTVRNVTGQNQDVTFPDGQGGTVTKTVEVPVPLVGSVTTTLPSNFTEVASDQANMAGDGKGGTKLSFTLTLFPPIASDTAEFGYTARIDDGLVPRTSITVLPVNPLENPTFKNAADSYQGGADTGIELADGATQIDENLLKLRDGAADLLAGLIQLRDGAQELEAGLAGEAAPGSQRLAAGADELNSGLRQLDDGAGQLAAGAGEAAAGSTRLRDGAGQLAAGAGEAAGGSRELAAGAGQLSDGIGDLSSGAGQVDAGATRLAEGQQGLADGLSTLYQAVEALPASVKKQLESNQEYQALLGALQAIADGVGTRTDAPDAGTLLGGINAIQYAMRFPSSSLDCDKALAGVEPDACGAMDGVDLVAEQLTAGVADLEAELKPGLVALYTTFNSCPAGPVEGFLPPDLLTPNTECWILSRMYFGLFGPTPDSAKSKLTAASQGLNGISSKVDAGLLAEGAGLDRLRMGLSNGDPANCLAAKETSDPTDDCGVKEAALFLKLYGIPMLVDQLATNISNEILAGLGKPTKNCDPEETLRCAAAALADGGAELSAGINQLVAGVAKLRAGGVALSDGAGELSVGLGVLADGSGALAEGTRDLQAGLFQLSGGAGQLADGTGQAAAGSTELADGAQQLSDGLVDAANGSGRLAGGLEKAAKGAPKLEDGAQRLSDEGTSKLIEAGESTAQNYGELYATIEAGAERGQAEKMVYGAPEGAIGLAAYSFEIKGEDGEDSRNLARGLGGLALLAAGAGAFALRRRVI